MIQNLSTKISLIFLILCGLKSDLKESLLNLKTKKFLLKKISDKWTEEIPTEATDLRTSVAATENKEEATETTATVTSEITTAFATEIETIVTAAEDTVETVATMVKEEVEANNTSHQDSLIETDQTGTKAEDKGWTGRDFITSETLMEEVVRTSVTKDIEVAVEVAHSVTGLNSLWSVCLSTLTRLSLNRSRSSLTNFE